MKFVLNFIFYGILFFLLSRYFPDGFSRLVEWVTTFWDFVIEIVSSAIDRIRGAAGDSNGSAAQSLMLPFVFISSFLKR